LAKPDSGSLMNLKDFTLLAAICFIWGLNIVVSRWVIFDMGVPPIFFAAIRFAGIALVLVYFLRPIPKDLKTLFAISMCIGAVHFALAFLGEVVGWRRGLGIMLAFCGAILIAVDPTSFSLSFGLVYISIAALIGSAGGILMKRMAPISALQMQAWIGLFSFAPLFALSGLVETGGWSTWISGGWRVWAATAFAILGVSVFGHGGFYYLIKKYDISFLSPLTLMTPIWGVVLSVTLLGEQLSLQLVVGAIISLGGVFVILVRPNKSMPEAALGNKARGSDL